MLTGLYTGFCLAWAGVIACVVLHEDAGGRLPWMLSVCAALLFTFLLLLVWLVRLVCGLYRWHPAVREVLFLLVAVMLCCWGFRGFSPITWYRLDVACCSGVGTTPTWHVSPWQRAYMLVFDDWSAGRFGHPFSSIIFPGWDTVPAPSAFLIMKAGNWQSGMSSPWIYPGTQRPPCGCGWMLPPLHSA